MRTLKAALPNLAFLGGFAVFFAWGFSALAQRDILGESGQGGNYFSMRSVNSEEDISYNREFQKNQYLLESPSHDGSHVTDGYTLASYGITQTNLKAGDFKKRAPHPKYY